MSIRADLEQATLSVLLDVRHPLAYLALHPAIGFAEAREIRINWLPLSVPALRAPSTEEPGDDRGIRHRRFRARAIAREIETYGRTQGLVIRDYYRDESAEAANLGWLWMRERHPDELQAYLIELFRRYWALDLDVSDIQAIAALVESLTGGERSEFLSWSGEDGPRACEAVAEELRAHGLFQVPAFVLGEEVFYGRQHLPMIGWLLDGRRGTAPI